MPLEELKWVPFYIQYKYICTATQYLCVPYQNYGLLLTHIIAEKGMLVAKDPGIAHESTDEQTKA